MSEDADRTDGVTRKVPPPLPSDLHPYIPDHDLIRCIGRGAYGEVWLARSVLGSYRAIKIVYRSKFDDDGPYEREFNGAKRFEPVSRSHEGFVDLLHVGRNDELGYFYYIMELADDASADEATPGADGGGGGRGERAPLDPGTYVAKTLKQVLGQRGNLELEECVALGLGLTSALDHLHKHQLIHRDLKPANIIFIDGTAKIADIGLVGRLGFSNSFVGTEGYIPPEGPGEAQGDLFSLGKVLYETCTGLDRRSFPQLPDTWSDAGRDGRWMELNEIVLKACKEPLDQRYATAEEMQDELRLLQAGKSVRKLRALERRLALMNRLLVGVGVLLFLAAGAYYLVARAERLTQQRLAEAYVAYGAQSADAMDFIGSLPWYAEGLQLERGDPEREQRYRVHMAMALRQCPRLVRTWFVGQEAEHAEFSRDGTRVVVAESDGSTHLWDVEADRKVAGFHGHTEGVLGAAFSPDGRHLATAGVDRRVLVWDLDQREVLQTLPHGAKVSLVQFHPLNPDLLLTAGADKQAVLWNWRTAEVVTAFTNRHTEPVRSARFNADGTLMVTASEDGTAQVWEVATGAPAGPPLSHTHWVYDAAFSPDGRWVVTGSFDNTAALWDAQTGRRLWTWFHDAAVGSVDFSPDGQYVVTASWDLSTQVWDAQNPYPRPAWPPIKHTGQVHCVRFDGTGRRVITASAHGVVAIWDLAPVNWRPPEVDGFVSGDGRLFATHTSGVIRLFSAAASEPASAALEVTGEIRTLLPNQDGSRWVVLTREANPGGVTRRWARLWEPGANPPRVPTPFLVHETTSNDAPGTHLSASGELLAVWQGHTLTVWSTSQRQVVRSLSIDSAGPNQAIAWFSVAFDPTDRFVAFSLHTNAMIGDLTGTHPPVVLAHPHEVQYATFSPSGRHLVTTCKDSTLLPREARRWSVPTGTPTGPAYQHRDGIWTAVFSPDGHRLVTASEDETAQVWDTVTARRLTPPMRHKFQIFDAHFNNAGDLVATASGDHTARVWNAETGQALTPPLRHDDEVWYARFIANDTAVLTTTPDGSWRWEIIQDDRPVDDLYLLAQLLSCHSVEPIAGTLPLDRETLERLWQELRSRYPDSFAVTAQEIFDWHRRELESCESKQRWPSALFHVERLLRLRPGDPQLLRTREILAARLDAPTSSQPEP